MRLFSSAIAALLIISSSAFAITIDIFDTPQSQSLATAGAVGSTVTSLTSLGGTRNLTIQNAKHIPAGAAPILNALIAGGILDHSQNSNSSGRTTVTWDGSPQGSFVFGDVNSVDTNGLGATGIDFTKDNGDRFFIELDGQTGTVGATKIRVRVFDAVQSSPGLPFFSEIEKTYPINTPINETIEFPFSSFSNGAGSFGPANFANIGAIQIIIDGINAPATDMTILSFKTNGRCELIPVNGVILGDCDYCADQAQPKNECGQCESTPAGPNPNYRANCRDCLGVMCVLQGDPRNALCTDTNTVNSCGICDANPDNDTPDACGVCGGNGLSCAGCDGISNSGLVPDICGVCGGNGTSCLDCAGNPFGSVIVDNCGVCGGTNACNDCSGTPNGTKVKDRCGVCDGNGQSCVSCESQDLRPLAYSLDAQAKEQENAATRMLTHLKQAQRTAAISAYSKKVSAQIRKLQLRNWVLSWSIELDNIQCVDPSTSVKPTFCAERTVNTSQIDEYRKNANTIYKLTLEIAGKLKKASKKKIPIAQRGERDGKRKLEKALELADEVPLKATVCS